MALLFHWVSGIKEAYKGLLNGDILEGVKTHINATEYEIAHPDEAAEIYAKWENANVATIKHSINATDMRWIHDPHLEIESGIEYAKVIYELNKERYESKGIKVLEAGDIFDTRFYDEVTDKR